MLFIHMLFSTSPGAEDENGNTPVVESIPEVIKIVCFPNTWCDYYQEFKTDVELRKRKWNLSRHKRSCNAKYIQKKVYRKTSVKTASYIPEKGSNKRS